MVADGCVLPLESIRAALVHGTASNTCINSLRRLRDGSTHPRDDLRAYCIMKIMFPHGLLIDLLVIQQLILPV